ncbi:GNAT family N-acetyltransferase [Lysinibacillus sp. NPDC093197]|uniref:GNAT family N-acetyltransferase n=1 Tax=Lysinibacillus sp. NPDC093197 TaxID=3364132 RepID=UPI003806E94F
MHNLFTIDCGEILLREFSSEDVDGIYKLTSQPEVYEFLPDWCSTREQRLNWIINDEIPSNKAFLSAIPNINGQNYLKLAIILKETGEFIGFCNTGPKEELSEPNQEIAYAMSKHFRNRGYTTKAVKGLLHFLFEQTNIEQLNAIVQPRNVSSLKVIEKCGFVFKENIEIDALIYRHYILHIEDWKNRKVH